jgi:hypothetical protein
MTPSRRHTLRSTGALTIGRLAAEAEVKRRLLTHKHRDFAEQFQARAKAAGGDPPRSSISRRESSSSPTTTPGSARKTPISRP